MVLSSTGRGGFLKLGVLFVLLAIIPSSLCKKTPAPVDFRATDITPFSITLSWSVPGNLETGDKVKGYRLVYRATNEKKSKKLNIGKNPRRTEISDLAAGTSYTFELAIKSTRGIGRFTDELIVTTPAAEPTIPLPGVPKNFETMVTSGSSIFCRWYPPDGSFSGYVIGIGESFPNETEINLNPSARSYTFENLTPGREYALSLKAFNDAGDGQPTLQRTMIEHQLPAPPINLRAVPSIDSIVLTWTSSSDQIREYVVGIGTEDLEERTVTVNWDETTYTFDRLTPNTLYLISIRSVNENGPGEAATDKVTTDDVSLPETPAFVSLETTTDSIFVTWYPPVQLVTGITISLEGYSTVSLAPGTTSYSFGDLEADTEYVVSLRMANFVGDGEAVSERVRTDSLIETEPPVEIIPTEAPQEPFRARNFSVELTEGTTAIVTWNPPIDEDVLEGYLIGIKAESISMDTTIRLHYRQTSYTFRQLEPLVTYTMTLEPLRRDGDAEAVSLSFTTYYADLIPPINLQVDILSSRSADVSWVDPTKPTDPSFRDTRYYTLRYRPVSVQGAIYLYENTRERQLMIGDLDPSTNYEFSVQTVLDEKTSGYSAAVRNGTFSETDILAPRLLTIVQLLLDYPSTIHATLNWIPPQERAEDVTGYNLQYSKVETPGPSDWIVIPTEGNLLSTTVSGLSTNMTVNFRIQALFTASETTAGPFSPDITFNTPISSAAAALADEAICETELETVSQRVTEVRERGSGIPPLGVPLPFCDEYYSQYACPWPQIICTCIPRGSSVVASVPSFKRSPGCYQSEKPCQEIYNQTMKAMREARSNGVPLMGANLPHCSSDGYFESKQCAGTMCYCVDRNGNPTGDESPVWEANSLIC